MVPTPSAAFAPTAVPSPRCCLAASIVDRTASVTDAMTASAGAGLAQRSPMADDQHDTARPVAPPSRTDYTVTKGEVSLAIYRKHRGAPAPGQPPCPVLFLVHGSSNSALSSFDLTVPGAGEYSAMNVFAARGFDVWRLDQEDYGRSSRTSGNCD